MRYKVFPPFPNIRINYPPLVSVGRVSVRKLTPRRKKLVSLPTDARLTENKRLALFSPPVRMPEPQASGRYICGLVRVGLIPGFSPALNVQALSDPSKTQESTPLTNPGSSPTLVKYPVI